MSMRDEPNNERTKEMAAVDGGTVSDTSGRPKAQQVPERHINCMSTEFPGKAHQGPKSPRPDMAIPG